MVMQLRNCGCICINIRKMKVVSIFGYFSQYKSFRKSIRVADSQPQGFENEIFIMNITF